MNKAISPASFQQIRDYVYQVAGIVIGAEKTAMVTSRLWRRLEATGCADYEAYLAFLRTSAGERERSLMLDLLTTNETYFFREQAHFKHLAEQILPAIHHRPVRIWCAAASTGEEAYSLAMVLAEQRGWDGWDLLATDISSKALTQAEHGLYRMERLENMSPHYLKTYCLRGVNEFNGQMAINAKLRARVRFARHNLLQPLIGHNLFDVIFLRNVLIYFDQPTKARVINHALARLRPGGWLILGHCESLMGMQMSLVQEAPSIYRKQPHSGDSAAVINTRRLPACESA